VQAFLSAARDKKLDRVGAAYAVAAWLVVQGASIALPSFGTPAWALRTIIAIAIIGFPVALFVAWFSVPHPHPETVQKRGGLAAGEFALLGLLGCVLLLSLAQLSYQIWSGSSTAPRQGAVSTSTVSPKAGATETMRVAIIPFDVVGTASDATQIFADTLLDKIVAALSANQVETVSRSDSLSLRGGSAKANAALADLRVGLALEGSVQNDGKTITVRLHLDDVRQHETLWSKEFTGPADLPEPLQTQVALHATDVTRWAVSPKMKEIRSSPSLVSAYLEGEDENINEGGGRSLTIARDLVAQAPRFAAGHTLLASTVGQENGLEIVTPQARAQSIREAKTAIALDGGDGQAYAMLSANLPALSFKAREDLLLKGLSVDPGNASANWNYTVQILASTGRTEDAIAQARAAWNLAPFTEWVAWSLPLMLANAGRIEEARDAIAQMKRRWPDNPDVYFKWVDFIVESQKRPYTGALALLDDADLRNLYERPPFGRPGAVGVLRTAIRAQTGSPAVKRTAAQFVEKSMDERQINPFVGIPLLSSLGDVDGAFRIVDRTLTLAQLHQLFGSDLGVGSTYLVLFGPQTVELRRDRRFLSLTQRLGLLDYWRSSGHWPDFCSEPGLPYDCKAVGATLSLLPAREH
jgi:TolB-like protein